MTAEEMRQAAISWEMVPDLRRPRESPWITYQDCTVPVEFYRFYNDPQAVMAACETFYGMHQVLPLDGSGTVRWDLPDWYLYASQDGQLNRNLVSLVRCKGWEYAKTHQEELLWDVVYTYADEVALPRAPTPEEEPIPEEFVRVATDTWLDNIAGQGLDQEPESEVEEEDEDIDNDVFADFANWEPDVAVQQLEPTVEQVEDSAPQYTELDFWRWVGEGRPAPCDSLDDELWLSFTAVYSEQGQSNLEFGGDSIARAVRSGIGDNQYLTEVVRNAAFPPVAPTEEEAEDSPEGSEDNFDFSWDELGGG
jgi:hypothetical protein